MNGSQEVRSRNSSKYDAGSRHLFRAEKLWTVVDCWHCVDTNTLKNDCCAGKEHKVKQHSHDTERMALRNMEHGRWTGQSVQLKSRLNHHLRDSQSGENGARERN